MSRSIAILMALAVVAPGCSLVFDANDHLGGSLDAAIPDSGPTPDSGPHDGGAPMDAPPGPDAALDGGPDGGPPPPPECTTAADCGAPGLVQCLDQRCRFCATPAAGIRTLREGSGVRPQVALAFGLRTAGPPFVHVASFATASTSPSEWYRFEYGGSTVDMASIESAITITCPHDRLLGGSFRDDGGGDMLLGFLGARAADTRWMFVGWREGEGAGSTVYDCRGVVAPEAMLGPLVPIDGTDLFAARLLESRGSGMIAVESGYGNAGNRGIITTLGVADTTHVAHANGFVAASNIDRSREMFWNQAAVSTVPGGIDTPGRTTDADLVSIGTNQMLMAYGVGDLIRIVPVQCTTGTCAAMGESADVRADRDVLAVRIAVTGGMPLLLTAERAIDGPDQLVLRALRPSRAPWDAPGGGRALVIETAPAGEDILDVQLATTGTGANVRHALAWLRQDGDGAATVLAHELAGACEP